MARCLRVASMEDLTRSLLKTQRSELEDGAASYACENSNVAPTWITSWCLVAIGRLSYASLRVNTPRNMPRISLVTKRSPDSAHALMLSRPGFWVDNGVYGHADLCILLRAHRPIGVGKTKQGQSPLIGDSFRCASAVISDYKLLGKRPHLGHGKVPTEPAIRV